MMPDHVRDALALDLLIGDLPPGSTVVETLGDVPCIYIPADDENEMLSIVETFDGFDIWRGPLGIGGPVELNATRQAMLRLAWRVAGEPA